ncbi:MAG: hypothetical protein U0359_42265 [Byssovorax sp.]
MSALLKAHVRAGRLVLDEPTTLPEGTEVALFVDPVEALDEADRDELEALLEESLIEARAGQEISNDEAFRQMAMARASALAAAR